jgi:hypothetical protein
VSAAEVYVFISGAVMGIVYHNVFIRQGLGAMLMKAFYRAWQLYVLTILLTLSCRHWERREPLVGADRRRRACYLRPAGRDAASDAI